MDIEEFGNYEESDDDEEELWWWKVKVLSLWCDLLVLQIKARKRAITRRKRPHDRLWTRLHNTEKKRQKHSWYHTLIKESALNDHYTYFNLVRMTPTTFESLLLRLGRLHWIRRSNTKFRMCISLGERLAITLRYLATGDKLKSIAYSFRIGASTATEIVNETTKALYEVLAPECLKVPGTHEWRRIAEDFWNRWNFPHCCGAIDGKHIALKCPPKSGSDYYNYKGFFSIVLMAVCDARYNFTLVDIGAYGREGDRNVYNSSEISKTMQNGTLGLPPSSKLPNTENIPARSKEAYPLMPFGLVGDEAFPLTTNLWKPYPGRATGYMPKEQMIFNYRLSRARRIIENTFGIYAARWQIFLKPICAKPQNVQQFVKAGVVLHNFLSQVEPRYAEPGFVDRYATDGSITPGQWRDEVEAKRRKGGSCFTKISPKLGANSARAAKQVRETFTRYFTTHGRVDWQDDIVDEDGFEPFRYCL